MTDRLTSAVAVSAVIRRVSDAGGSAMVLARGDAHAGGILALLLDRGASPRFVERGYGPDGTPEIRPAGPADLADESAAAAYWRRRRRGDPDLWVIELDIADAQRLVVEMLTVR